MYIVQSLQQRILQINQYHLEPAEIQSSGSAFFGVICAGADRPALLKLANPANISSRQALQRERSALTDIVGHHVIVMLDWGEFQYEYLTGERVLLPYVVLPRFDTDVAQVMLNGRGRTWPECLHLLTSVARALRVVESFGFVHGDVKPNNILVAVGTPSEYVMADFGCARRISDDAALPSMPFLNKYRPLDDLYTTQLDMYAFGVIMWEVAMGEGFERMLLAPTSVRSESLVPKRFAKTFDDISSGCRRPDRRDRPRSFADIEAALSDLCL